MAEANSISLDFAIFCSFALHHGGRMFSSFYPCGGMVWRPKYEVSLGYGFCRGTGGSFVLIAWNALYFGVKHYQTIEDQHSQLLASQALAHDAQLEALRYQLQPHFLFNTLNAISSLVITKQTDTAAGMIARLAGLLRSTLSSPERHAVTLPDLCVKRRLDDCNLLQMSYLLISMVMIRS